MTDALEVRPARGAAEIEAALGLRYEVFCGEQGVTEDEERDGRDRDALHLVAVDAASGAVVGTCRLLLEDGTVKLGRLAVAPAARRRGIATALLAAAEDAAREWGAERISLAAQAYATGLYETAGYAAHGEPFIDARIEHVWMEKPLA